jgi:hypothetical protein
MCHVASMTVMYIGLGTIQLSHHLSDGVCVGLGNICKSTSSSAAHELISTFLFFSIISGDCSFCIFGHFYLVECPEF